MSKNDSPCYQCSERYAGCHATCDKYKTWQVQHLAEQREIRKKEEEQSMMRSYYVESGYKIKKDRKDRKK